MKLEALPATLKYTLQVHLYLPTGSIHIDTSKFEDNGFRHLFGADIEIPVPPIFQSRDALTQCAVAGVDEAIRQARVKFEEQIQSLERTRQQFLALEA
jgi:hypothetical protein